MMAIDTMVGPSKPGPVLLKLWMISRTTSFAERVYCVLWTMCLVTVRSRRRRACHLGVLAIVLDQAMSYFLSELTKLKNERSHTSLCCISNFSFLVSLPSIVFVCISKGGMYCYNPCPTRMCGPSRQFRQAIGYKRVMYSTS